MRFALTTLLAATTLALLAPSGSQAASNLQAISKVLASCPVEARVGTCANAVVDFANALPASTERNGDLLSLAGALADEAKGTQVSPIVCQELEASIRLAGQAAAGATTKDAIKAIADGLCADDVDYTTTGAIDGGYDTGGDDPFEPPVSLIEKPANPAPLPIEVELGDGGGDEGGDDEEEDPIFEDG